MQLTETEAKVLLAIREAEKDGLGSLQDLTVRAGLRWKSTCNNAVRSLREKKLIDEPKHLVGTLTRRGRSVLALYVS